MKIKEDIHLERPLPSPSSSSFLQRFLTVKVRVKVETCLMNTARIPLCVAVKAENGRFTPGMSQQRSENKFLKCLIKKRKTHVSVTHRQQSQLYSKQAPSVAVIY